MVVTCCSYGCSNSKKKNPAMSFYRIPADPERRALWIAAIGRKNWKPNEYSRLCGAHFQSGAKSDNVLSPDYVPSVFDDTPYSERRKGLYELEAYRRRQKRESEQKAQNIHAVTPYLDRRVDADMDDPLKNSATMVKEEITFKEEVIDESDIFIDPCMFSVPAGKAGVKRERESSEETETATEGGTSTYGSEDDWMVHPVGRKSQLHEPGQRFGDPLETDGTSYDVLASQNIDQKAASADPKVDENPTKRLRSLEEPVETKEGPCEGDASDPLNCSLPESAEEILLKKDIELKKKEIEMRKKALELMHSKCEPGKKRTDEQDSDLAVIELLKSDLHIAVEELELLLQERAFLCNSKRISHLELKLKKEEINMREEVHQMKLKINDIKKAYLFESSQMNGGRV